MQKNIAPITQILNPTNQIENISNIDNISIETNDNVSPLNNSQLHNTTLEKKFNWNKEKNFPNLKRPVSPTVTSFNPSSSKMNSENQEEICSPKVDNH